MNEDLHRVESWSLYGVAVAVFVARIFARIYRLGFRGLNVEDCGMSLAIISFTALIICLNSINSTPTTNLYNEAGKFNFSDAELQERIRASKITHISKHAWLCTIWAVKFCLLFLYTSALHSWTPFIILTALYSTAGFIACEATLFLQCRPFDGYWTFPPPLEHCANYHPFAFVSTIANLSTYLPLFAISLPLLLKPYSLRPTPSQLPPPRRRIAILLLFSIGIFAMCCAALASYFTLTSHPLPAWTYRETSAAVILANLPAVFSLLPSKSPNSPDDTDDLELSISKRRSKAPMMWETANDSQERLAGVEGGIRQDVTFTIETEERVGWEMEGGRGRTVYATESGETRGHRHEYSVQVEGKKGKGSHR